MTCQDLETLDLDDFQHNNLNLTGLRLVQRSRGFVQDLLLQMRVYENRSAQPDLYILNSTGVISVSAPGACERPGVISDISVSVAFYGAAANL